MWTIAEAQLLAGQYENAIGTSNRAITRQPDHWVTHAILTAANSTLYHREDAQNEAAEVLGRDPNFTVDAWMKTRLLKNPADVQKYADLLLKAGLPGIQP